MKGLVALLGVMMLSACASVPSEPRPMDYYEPTQEAPAEGELFGNGEASLSDEDIKRILDYRVRLPRQNRVAILRLSRDNYWRFYSNDFVELTDSMASGFIGQLRSSERVYDASFLPAMLLPEKRTVPFLREAAARFQADLLLVYRSDCRTFEKYRFLNPDETKAYCTVEAVLLDVRSGIVPFSVVSTKEYATATRKEDTNFSETIKKAELHAVSQCLEEVGLTVKEFIAKTEVL